MTRFNLRRSLLATTIMVGSLATAPAFAQDATAPAPAAEVADDTTIVVTGSLISNPNLQSSVPVNVTSSEEVRLRQSNVAEEVLRNIPGVVANIGAQVNNGNGGASYVDLRGLGSFRNIVLLDGNRIAPSDTVGRTDLNNIPLALIERTEALTGGASTTYGADAISGVVNFVTKSDFSGVEISAGNSITEAGDGNTNRLDVTVGANIDDGRGNVVLSVGYQQADPVSQGDRAFSNTQYSSSSGKAGGSDATAPTVIVLDSELAQIDVASGTFVPVYERFNFNPYNVFQTPFKRFNIFGAGHYEVTDNIEVYARALFSKNTVDTIIAPSGVFGEDLRLPLSNPYLPSGARDQLCADQGISPAECQAGASALSQDDPNYRELTVTILRRTPDVGPRISNYVTTVFDYRAGIRGDITDTIKFDVAGAYGESENLQTIRNYVLTSRVQQALLATNQSTCLTTTNGCVPLNLFGGTGSITPEMASFLTANSTTLNRTTLSQARALISGDFGLVSPGATDAVSFAVGAEYRKYSASQASDLLAQTAGELGGAGGAAPNIDGGYDVYEAFGELVAPLVQDRPFFKSLTVEGGIRYSRYTVDAPGNPKYNTTTWKAGGSWEPVTGFRVRGNYQRAVRAPTINELFDPVTTGLTNLETEPCVGTAVLEDPNLRAVCLAQGAPLSSLGTIQGPNSGQANLTSGGNQNLNPEVADTYTIGVILRPDFIPGFTVTVDYYDIKVNNAITIPTPGDIISACFDTLSPSSATNPACTSIRRNPGTGQLSGSPATTPGLPAQSSNLGRLATDGVDLIANYQNDLGFAKLSLSFSGNWTRSNKFKANTRSPSSVNRECVGFYSVNCPSIQPDYSWNQRTTLGFADVDLSLLWRHISGTRVEPLQGRSFSGPLSGGDLNGRTVNFNRVSAYDWFDLASQFTITKNVELTLTVTNIFDRKPPVLGNTIGDTAYNSGNTYPSTYDALGRRYAASVRLNF